MARFKKIPQVHEGKIVYGNNIVDNIVYIAVSEIPFVELASDVSNNQMRSNSISVKKEKDCVAVDVNVRIHFSQSVSDIAFKIQEAVRQNVESMTGYHVSNVNVTISGVTFEDKADEHKKPAEETQVEGQ